MEDAPRLLGSSWCNETFHDGGLCQQPLCDHSLSRYTRARLMPTSERAAAPRSQRSRKAPAVVDDDRRDAHGGSAPQQQPGDESMEDGAALRGEANKARRGKHARI